MKLGLGAIMIFLVAGFNLPVQAQNTTVKRVEAKQCFVAVNLRQETTPQGNIINIADEFNEYSKGKVPLNFNAPEEWSYSGTRWKNPGTILCPGNREPGKLDTIWINVK